MVQIDNTSLISDKSKTTEEHLGQINSMHIENILNTTQNEQSMDNVFDQPRKLITKNRLDLAKAKQGFSVLSVALGSQALTLTSLLVEDLSSEIKGIKTFRVL